MIAVFDVNVVISAVIAPHGASRAMFDRFREGSLHLVISPGMIEEVRAKLLLSRIAHRYRITPADAAAVVALLLAHADVVDVPDERVERVTGDPEDDYVLATCVVSAADHLITGDKRLLELGVHGGTRIVAPRSFLGLIEEWDADA